MIAISQMCVNLRQNNIAVGREKPCFSWRFASDESNVLQRSYQIRVSKAASGELIWDSGLCRKADVEVVWDGAGLAPDSAYVWELSCDMSSDRGRQRVSGKAGFETGLFDQSDWRGIWIGETEPKKHHLFRRKFMLKDRPASAKLYVSGLGHYEGWLNGRKIGEDVLEPGWTNYDKRCLYSAYDVKDMLRAGENMLGLWLGDGMFNATDEGYVYFSRSYGLPRFILQLSIIYPDGSAQQVVSDRGWQMTPGPLIYSGIYGGEDFDARLLREGFYAPGSTPEGNAAKSEAEDALWQSVQAVDAPKGRLCPQLQEPLRVMRRLTPKKVWKSGKGSYVYDFGTNFSGWVHMDMRLPGGENNADFSGKEIRLIPSEILGKDGCPEQKLAKGYHWRYIISGAPRQEYRPKFTYFGFRYVELSGAVPEQLIGEEGSEALPVVTALTGEFIYPDKLESGGFECSNQLFNAIHGIICQAMRSNIKSYMTDCPHREKLGWLEQSHLIGPSIMYNFNVRSLYRKIQQDIEDSQRPNGLVPDICPEYVVFGYHEGFVDSPEWGSACILNAWYLYRMYGDKSLFDSYETMRRYILHLKSRTYGHLLHHGLGDWLDIGPMKPYSQNTPVPLVASAMYYYDLCVMEKIAGILGKKADRQQYRREKQLVHKAYNRHFLDDQTNRYANGSQAAQAMSLIAGLVPSEREEKVADMLVRDIVSRGYAVTAGDVGHPFVVAALTRYGKDEILNKMTLITDRPGYGYQVVSGATTLTEDWDGPEIGNPHGSQNHLMLGSIEEWFYGALAGLGCIRKDAPAAGLLLEPVFAEGIDRVSAWTTYPCGEVRLEWTRKDARSITLTVEIPPNMQATLRVGGGDRRLGSGKHVLNVETNTNPNGK